MLTSFFLVLFFKMECEQGRADDEYHPWSNRGEMHEKRELSSLILQTASLSTIHRVGNFYKAK